MALFILSMVAFTLFAWFCDNSLHLVDWRTVFEYNDQTGGSTLEDVKQHGNITNGQQDGFGSVSPPPPHDTEWYDNIRKLSSYLEAHEFS